MNEELKQKAKGFNDAQKQDFNSLVAFGLSPDEAVLTITGGKAKDLTFGEQAIPAVKDVAGGFKRIVQSTRLENLSRAPREILGGAADIVRGGSGLIGATIETADDLVTSGLLGNAATNIITPIAQTQVVQDVMSKLSAFNKSTGGVAGDIATIASVIPGVKVFGKVSQTFGEAASAASKLKTAPLANYLLKAGKVDGAPDTITGLVQNVSQRISTNKERIASSLKDQARISKLPKEEASAIRGGVPEQDLSTFKEIFKTPDEGKVVKEMFDNASKEVADKTVRADAQREILGREFLKPVEYLTEQKVKIGSELGSIRESLDGVKKINTNKAFQEFYKMLTEKYGAKLNKGEFITDAAGASGSLEKSTVDALAPQLKKLYSQTFTTQKDIDNWLRSSLNEFDVVNSVDKVKAPDTATRIIKDTRGIYKSLMPDNYNKALEDYAKVVAPLGKVNQLLKITSNIDDLTVKALKAGEVARRLGGNASADLKGLIEDVVSTANSYGYTSKVNLNRLATIADDIDRMYDINRPTSLRGDMSAAVSGLPPTTMTGAVMKTLETLIGGNYSKEETRKLLKAWIDKQ